MKQTALISAILGAVALPAQAAQPAAAESAEVGVSPATASFSDGPTGYHFVWQRDTGWKFDSRNKDADAKAGLVKKTLTSAKEGFEEGAPVAEFVDASTGFRFVWRYGAGWQFAGTASGQRAALQQVAALGSALR